MSTKKEKLAEYFNKNDLPKISKFKPYEEEGNTLEDRAEDRENKTLEVDPSLVKIWSLKDRSKSKLKLDDLIDRIRDHGQLVPCIVKEIKSDPLYKYELLAGRKRLMAVKELGLRLKISIENPKDNIEALIIQNDENERDNPSDYDRGIHYSSILEQNIFKNQSDLARAFKKDRQYVSKVLMYAKIPNDLQEAIDDFDKVSAATAEALVTISSKNEQSKEALISIASEIRAGLGASTIRKRVEKLLSISTKPNIDFISRKVHKNGIHIFTWKLDQNDNVCISFTSELNTMLFNQNKIENEIIKALYEERSL